MSITTILNRKGDDVLTIDGGATLHDAVARLAEVGVGALVVSGDGRTVEGIISERDIVAALARHGESCLQRSVAETMTRHVTTCAPDAAVNAVMATMTHRRMRHIPVVDDGELRGIVSIGDVVKFRIDELEAETASLQDYVLGRTY